MKMMCRIFGTAAVVAPLLLTSGCVSSDGRPDNTGTGALMGGAFGAMIGAVADRGHPGAGALIGGAAGLVAGGLIGHTMDEQQQRQLQQQSPDTYYKIQNNDAAYAGGPPPPPPAGEPAPAAAPAPATPDASSAPAAAPAASAPAAAMQPLSLDDIKALASAGVKADAINKEIEISQSKFTAQDIAAAKQATPPVDPAVIACMQSHSS